MSAQRNGLRQFTLRVPEAIFDMLRDQARTQRRTINGEINVILEDFIDQRVAVDQELLKKINPTE